MKKLVFFAITISFLMNNLYAVKSRNSFFMNTQHGGSLKAKISFENLTGLSSDGTKIAKINTTEKKIQIIDAQQSHDDHLVITEEIDLSLDNTTPDDATPYELSYPKFVCNDTALIVHKTYVTNEHNSLCSTLILIDLTTSEFKPLINENEFLSQYHFSNLNSDEIFLVTTDAYFKYADSIKKHENLLKRKEELFFEKRKLLADKTYKIMEIGSNKDFFQINKSNLKHGEELSGFYTLQDVITNNIDEINKKIEDNFKYIEECKEFSILENTLLNEQKELEENQQKLQKMQSELSSINQKISYFNKLIAEDKLIEKKIKRISLKIKLLHKKTKIPKFKILKLNIKTMKRVLVETYPFGNGDIIFNSKDQIIAVIHKIKKKSWIAKTKVMIKQSANWEEKFSVSETQSLKKKYINMSDDGKKIYYLSSEYTNFKAAYELNIESGAHTQLHEHPNADIRKFSVIDAIDEPGLADINGKIIYKTCKNKPQLHSTYSKIQPLIDYINNLDLDFFEGLLSSKNFCTLLLKGNLFKEPGMFYLYDLKSLSEEKSALETLQPKKIELFPENRTIDEGLSPMKAYQINARDGLELNFFVTLPKTPTDTPYPFIVNVHGGPWMNDKLSFNPENQFWADREVGTVHINYRGSTGYGNAFLEAGFGEWGAKMIDDIEDVVEHLIDKNIIDKNRVVISGFSYGGNAVYSALAFKPDLFVAGMAGSGDVDLYKAVKSTSHIATKSYLKTLKFGNPNMTKKDRKAMSLLRSPIHHIANIQAPLLIISPVEDEIVSYEQTKLMIDALNKYDKEYVAFKIEKAGHDMGSLENRMAVLALQEDFLKDIFNLPETEPIEEALENAPDVVQVK